jgi:hypothetical protein
MNKTFSANNAIKFGWTTFKSNWKFWLVVYLIAFALGGPSLGSSKKEEKDTSTYDRSRINNQNSPLQRNPGVLNDIENKVMGISDDRSLVMPEQGTTEPVLGAPAPIMPRRPFLASLLPLLLLLIPYLAVTAVGIIILCLYLVGISMVFKIGYTHLSLDAVRGNALNYTTLLSDVNFRKAIKLICVYALMVLVVIFGLAFFIIPGVYFGIKYMFAPFVLIDKNTGVMDAFSISSKITKGNMLKLLGLNILGVFISLIGLLTFIVGILPATIVMSLAFAYTYEALSKPTETTLTAVA